jgi:CheY-like chemotaxis protein
MDNFKKMSPIEILLIEDNMGDIRLTQETLKESKIKNILNYVKDGEEALLYLNKKDKYINVSTPDLILLDLNIPKKDGREVLEIIKTDSILKRIPVIVLTTSDSEIDILNTYDLHANSFITKPVDFNQFINVVKSIENYWIQIVKLPRE